MNCMCHFNHWGPVTSPAMQGRERSGCRQRSSKIAGGLLWVDCGAAVILVLCMLNLEKICSSLMYRYWQICRITYICWGVEVTKVTQLRPPRVPVLRMESLVDLSRWRLSQQTIHRWTTNLMYNWKYMNYMCHINHWGPVTSPAMQGRERSGCRQRSSKIACGLLWVDCAAAVILVFCMLNLEKICSSLMYRYWQICRITYICWGVEVTKVTQLRPPRVPVLRM